MEGGKLYVVATPIGNLEDITARALTTLRECDRIAAEDTRRTRGLLSHFGIRGKTVESLHAHSLERDVDRLVAALVAGESVAIVTDAGTPAVSDPGEELVRAAIAQNIVVVPIPGASAVLAALVGSGLSEGGGFRFFGFLPRDGTARREAIATVCSTEETSLIFESPNRIAATLQDLAAATPDRGACVARELTKMHEEFLRGTLATLATAAAEREWLGEIVLVLSAHRPEAREVAVTDDALDERIDDELAKGAHAKGLAERLAAWSGRSKRDVYERVLTRKKR